MLARAHQSAIWSRQRQVNALRSALREYYPAALAAFGTDLAASDAVAVLALAPTPGAARALSRSKIASALRRAGRVRNIDQRADEIQAALHADYLHAPPAIAGAYGAAARSAIRLITAYTAEIAELEQALAEHFEQHPDAKIVRSLPGLGTVLGARVLGEFGDDRTRFTSPKSRKNYSGTSPITRASGRSHVVLARHARNRRLAGRAVWLCAQGAGRAVSFCAQGAGPAVYSRQPGAQSYWPGSPGPALAAPPPRWRRQPPAHKSGGCAACESAQPARAAAPPTYCQDLRSADARQTRCCLPERWLPATCGHPALMLSCRLPISRPGISLADPAGPKLHRSAILARAAFGADIKPDLSADEHLRSPPGQRSRRQGRRSLPAGRKPAGDGE